MNYIGIDLGTSSVKIVLMDTAGHIIANVSKSYPIDYPKAGCQSRILMTGMMLV